MPSASKRLLVAAAAAAAVITASISGAQSAPRFFGNADAILVDVAVSRAGVPVEGLTAADFVVKDSGVVQSAQLVSTAGLPVSLLLAFDASASVRGEPLESLKAAAKAAVAALRPTDEAALLTFSHNVVLRSGWTTSREALTKAIDGVTGTGLTALNDAAMAALSLTPKPGSRRLILFFTDGDDTSSWTPASALLQAARRSDSVIYNVSLDSARNNGAAISRMLEARRKPGDTAQADLEKWVNADPSLYRGAALTLLTLETGGEALRAADAAKLTTTFTDVIARFGRRYVLAFTPTGVPATGWHSLEVEVKGGGEVTARRGYTR
jgi:VWFA-related protein